MLPGIKKRLVSFSDIMMYVAVGLKYGRLITLLMCVSLLVGLTYFVYAKPVYYARAVAQHQQVALPVDTETLFRDSNELSIAAEMGAPHIVWRAAARLGFRGDLRELEEKHIRKVKISFDHLRNIQIEVWPYQPHYAAPWGETLVEEYLRYRDERRARQRDIALQTYTNEMASLHQRMLDTQMAKAAFKETNEITRLLIQMNELGAVPVQLVMVSHRIQEMDRIKRSLDDSRLDMASKLSLMAAVKDREPLDVGQIAYNLDPTQFGTLPSGPLPQPLQRPGMTHGVIFVPQMLEGGTAQRWHTLYKERQQVQESVREAEKIYRPAHPKMAPLLAQLEKLDKELAAEYTVARNKFELEYAKLIDQRQELEGKLEAYKTSMAQYEQMQQASSEFEAGQLAWKVMFTELAKKVTAYTVGIENERARIEYLGTPELRNIVPVSPNRLKLVVISLILGLSLSIGVPFLFEYLDYTVNDVSEVEHTLSMRGLGIVPRVLEGATERFPLLGVDDAGSRHLLENFRVIRANLILHPGEASGEIDKTKQVIMVSSAVPKEGKTAISANLAISFAQRGEKTLLVDADLRRGRLHRLFGTRTSPGLSNILMEGAKLEETCRASFHENLDVLTCGRHLSGATELLGSPAFESVMADLRKKYQKIVIDTPPVLGLSETSMMQNLVDGVLFVISSNQTPMRSVKAAIDTLRANGAKFYGFVLNRIDLSDNANYYNYYYYSYHYYDRYQALEKAS
jgi:capsular exopolysaccharide synthesis family protein